MENDHRGITALVTGASKGLGRAYSLELARRGARVILLARSKGDLLELAALIAERHGSQDTEVITGDLAAPDGPERILHELHNRGLTVDLLINNAGAGSVGPFLTRPIEAQLRTVGLNISGLLALTYAIGTDLVARDSGGIINVSSTAAFQPMPYQASYAATKDPRAADEPAVVAAQTLDDYSRRRAVSYPGKPLNRVMAWAARLLPRTVTARVAGTMNRRLRLHETIDAA